MLINMTEDKKEKKEELNIVDEIKEIVNEDENENNNVEEEKEIEKTIKEKKAVVKDGIDIFDDNEEINLKEETGATQQTETAGEGKKKTEKSDKKGKKGKKKKKKKEIRKIANGRAYIQASYNNTIITLTDQNGNPLAIGSAGQLGFKGPKKSTPYAASIVVRDVISKVKEYGLQYVTVYVKGVGSGRESAVRALNANGLNVLAIKDVTPVPHNGCRKKKPRRV